MNRRFFFGLMAGAAVTPFMPKAAPIVAPLFTPGEVMFFLPSGDWKNNAAPNLGDVKALKRAVNMYKEQS